MIELFAIFSKGGIALWYFQETAQLFTDTVNKVLRDMIMQERHGVYKDEQVTVRYKLDNEFELVFVVVYQTIVQMTNADKLLTEVNLRFRDLYKNVLSDSQYIYAHGARAFKKFDDVFKTTLEEVMVASAVGAATKAPRSYESTAKAQKTMASLMVGGGKKDGGAQKKEEKQQQQQQKKSAQIVEQQFSAPVSSEEEEDDTSPNQEPTNGKPLSQAEIAAKLRKRLGKGSSTVKKDAPTAAPATAEGGKKKGKDARYWPLSGARPDEIGKLDYTSETAAKEQGVDERFLDQHKGIVGQLKGQVRGLDESDNEETPSDEEEDALTAKASAGGGWLGAFKSLVGGKKLTAADIEPALEKMKETLIAKNVAAEPAEKICQSVSEKLDGKVVSTFGRAATEVRGAVRDALTQLLTPKRRVDILRDVEHAKQEGRPYTIVFCGVNGVGKSTNLAKITFWLTENGYRVLIAAGDTFRAGAVEQLRTHTKHLNALHPNSVTLYEQGYGKDSATLAASAIVVAAERKIDVVLVDTAGRMQDNEPLMRELAKLIVVNEPDLVLFVGEALVGNEAVDQLVRFDRALADLSGTGKAGRGIDGIVLTKFDTIDDKVGAAISMTYITGQPIVFVGTGQTYKDLKSLNVGAVVSALLK